jgi:hypothetical protein
MKIVRTELDKEFESLLHETSRRLHAINNKAKSLGEKDIESQSLSLWAEVDRKILLRKGII